MLFFFYLQLHVQYCLYCVCVHIVDAGTDVLNNEKKTALEMATNAQCASLLKRKLGGGESKGVSFQLPP